MNKHLALVPALAAALTLSLVRLLQQQRRHLRDRRHSGHHEHAVSRRDS